MKIRFLLQPTSRITLKQETSLLDVFTSVAVRLLLSLKRGRERQKGACFLGLTCKNSLSGSEKMILGLCKISSRSLRTWGTSPLDAAERRCSLLLCSEDGFVSSVCFCFLVMFLHSSLWASVLLIIIKTF